MLSMALGQSAISIGARSVILYKRVGVFRHKDGTWGLDLYWKWAGQSERGQVASAGMPDGKGGTRRAATLAEAEQAAQTIRDRWAAGAFHEATMESFAFCRNGGFYLHDLG